MDKILAALPNYYVYVLFHLAVYLEVIPCWYTFSLLNTYVVFTTYQVLFFGDTKILIPSILTITLLWSPIITMKA